MAVAAPDPVEEEERPKSMAPGLGTIGGAPTDADSQAKPVDPPQPVFDPQAMPEPPGTPHPSRTPPAPKPFSNAPEVQVEKPKPFSDAPEVPVEKPKGDDKPKPFSSAPEVQVEQQPQQPVTPQPATPPPLPEVQTAPEAKTEGYGASAAVTADKTDAASQISHLMDQGLTSGQAQAVVLGQIPRSLSGKVPPPPQPKTEPAPATQPDTTKPDTTQPDTKPPPTTAKPTGPVTDEQAYQSLSEDDKSLYASGKNKLEGFGTPKEKPTPQEQAVLDRVKAQVAGTSPPAAPTDAPQVLNKHGQVAGYPDLSDSDKTLYASGVNKIQAGQQPTAEESAALHKGNFNFKGGSGDSTTAQDEPKTIVGGGMLKGTATTFGLNYDGSYDPDDNGVGFFGGVNTRNPKLKAVAVPVDVLEAAFGKFTQKNAQGGYDALDTPEAKKIIAEIRSAHVEALGLDGKIHNFPIVDIQGSLKGHPGKVLDMTPAAGRELGFNDNHSVSYQIVGGDGQPYAIPADQLAGWNSRSHEGTRGGGATLVPMVGTDSTSYAPERAQSSPESIGGGGGGGGGGQEFPASQGSGSGGLINFGRGSDQPQQAAAQAQPQASRQQMQVSAPLPDEQQQNPLVAALMNRGFTQQQALNFAQSSANVASAKGLPPINIKGPPPPAPITPTQLSLSSKQPVTPQILSTKQLMPGKQFVLGSSKGPPPAAPSKTVKAPLQLNAPPSAPSAPAKPVQAQVPPPKQVPAAKQTPAAQPPPVPPVPQKPVPQKPATDMPVQRQAPTEPTEFTSRPPGSTHGLPNPPGMEALSGHIKDRGKQHKALLSEDDPRVSKQADNLIKGEHFVEGDPYHDQLLEGLPYGKQGPQRQKLAQSETAIADHAPMHISYISSPKELEKFPTRESRRIQYDKSSPEARLMDATEGALVGHSMIPLNVGIKLPSKAEEKAGDPHQGYTQGISTNVMANNFQHLNDKLAAMGRKTPYKELGAKFANDLEGYYSNLLAGHTATGRGYATGTEDHPNEPDREHVPYKLSRKEADFIGAVINNTSAFAQHDDAKKIRELARANGTLITEKGETNRLLHDIEQADPGWSGRGTTGKGRVLEPSIKTFKTGLVHEVHPTEQHLPETIRPGKAYQALTKALARTSARGRPDIAIGASLHHTYQDNRQINEIERDFSDHKIDEAQARERLHAIGEDPDDFRFVSGSGGLITPYEDDPEALTPEEHTQMKDNLRQSWVSGKMNVEDYRKKSAEVPLPSKPSKAAAPKPVTVKAPKSTEPEIPAETSTSTTAEPVIAPKPPKPPKPKPMRENSPALTPKPEIAPDEPQEAPTTPPAPDEPLPVKKPKVPRDSVEAPATPPAPDEPLPVKKPKPVPRDSVEQKAPTPALEKPSWKTANEKTRQAYLKQRVAQDLEKQYKGADAHPLEIDRNDDKSIKYDPAGNPMYKKIDYDLANSPLLKKKGLNQIKNADKHEDTLGNLIGPDGKEVIDPETGKPTLKHAHLNQTERRRLSAMHTASAVHTMGNKIVDEFMKIKDQPEIMAGEGWYSRMRKKLADALGEHHELFAQLLGATSAKTPVRNNFIQSLDALEQFKNGKFDNHIKKYLEGYEKMREGKGALVQHMKNQNIPLYDKDGNTVDTHKEDAAAMANWIHHHGILPRQQIQAGQEEGSKYNANSIAVLKALAGTWLKEVGAPKTPNFAGNLTGRTLEATIDVWAARFLKRLGYEGHGTGPWRAQGKSEPGVNSLDFAFSQDAMRHAADEITKRTGKKMNPDDLQAIAWFAEKHHWEKQGWTRGAGAEKSSFDDVADLAFPKTGEPMTSADLRKHYAAIQAEAKRVKARVKTAKTYVGHANPKMRAKLEPYMAQHGLTHEQVHGPEVEEEDDDEAA
jgi:hypothetical protein